MTKEEVIHITGKVVNKLPNASFRIRMQNGREIIATLSGKMRKNYIRILIGDSVQVEVSPYDLKRGRIVYRDK